MTEARIGLDLNAMVTKIHLEADAGDGRMNIEKEALSLAIQQRCSVEVTVIDSDGNLKYELDVDFEILEASVTTRDLDTKDAK